MYFVCVVVAGRGDTAQDLAHLRLVIDELQQRLPMRTSAADAEDVLGRGIEVGNKEIVVQQDDARVQAVEYAACVSAERAVARATAL